MKMLNEPQTYKRIKICAEKEKKVVKSRIRKHQPTCQTAGNSNTPLTIGNF